MYRAKGHRGLFEGVYKVNGIEPRGQLLSVATEDLAGPLVNRLDCRRQLEERRTQHNPETPPLSDGNDDDTCLAFHSMP